VSGSGISWAICKSAPRSRQITTPATHHSVFYRPDALPAGAQPTVSKHFSVRKSTTYHSMWKTSVACIKITLEAQINHLLAMISTNTKQLVLNLVNAAVLQEVQSTGKPVQLAHDGVLFTSLLSWSYFNLGLVTPKHNLWRWSKQVFTGWMLFLSTN